MTLTARIQSIENGITLNPADNYEYELNALSGTESDLPVYRYMGTPVYKIVQAKEDIARIRAWILAEIEHNKLNAE